MLRERLHRVRAGAGLAAQAGLAAGLAWWVAGDLLGIPKPVFAPISAVVTLAASVGQRLRRTVELVLGVAVGILIGDLLIALLGTGAWQLGLIVVLAVLVAAFVGRSPALVVQAGATAVLLGTLSPSVPNLEIPRFADALIGGAVALAVTAVLLPLNPLRTINRAAGPALDLLVDQLEATATALRQRDAARARAARDRLRNNKKELGAFGEAAQGAREATMLSPVYWSAREGPLGRYAQAVEPIDRAMRNSGTLIRRAVTLIEDGEPIPDDLLGAVSALAEAVRTLRREFVRGASEPKQARERALRAVARAGHAYRAGVGFSGSVVVAQVRTTVSDLLVATDLAQDDANELVRRAFGALTPPSGPDRAPRDEG
ncbi:MULTISPECIES: aromatic acid exporter family protein [Micromonospora]|uniref:Aromatic acid exporter family protein n=1 Tax=Micromonospora solifontis TaxID=2487138 RepID=A0ABX9WLS4_9ACTN|nr:MULTISPECIES: FUSC family protein [Micromonospora]NES14774.1 aromatic acid exporter family protein [Micromonospora sp. PPF5-17B]NES35338.1 aromatic acid exporter family protein [Micromonospora solifontis]NES56180.1 aromatic acid exporter family protein [Micromonospora sp. PPF5-6]RNM00838.1 aromatic acid exporter family protein [Micromonospora solifontis]